MGEPKPSATMQRTLRCNCEYGREGEQKRSAERRGLCVVTVDLGGWVVVLYRCLPHHIPTHRPFRSFSVSPKKVVKVRLYNASTMRRRNCSLNSNSAGNWVMIWYTESSH